MKFQFDKTPFEKILDEYAKITMRSIPDAVAASARLLCVELAKRTQPFGDKETARAVGEKAITRDLRGGSLTSRKRVGLFGIADFTDEEGFAWYATGPNVRLFITKEGRVYGTDKSYFKPNVSQGEMRKFHKSKFRNGRMSAAGASTRDVGRWKFIEKWFVDKNSLDQYVDSQLKKVGWAKAGWASCAREIRRVTKGSATRGIPRFVTRHDSPYSDVIDNTNDTKNPRVTLINSTPYIRQVLSPSSIEAAKGAVITRMMKQMQNIIRGNLKKQTAMAA